MSGPNSWRWLVVQLVDQLKASPRKTGLVGILAVVLMAVVVRQFSTGPAPVDASAPIETVEAGGEAAVPSQGQAAVARPLPGLPQFAARDPFGVDWTLFQPTPSSADSSRAATPTDEPAPELPDWNLELTLTAVDGKGRPSAVINGRQVGVGDEIEGAKVESIAAGEVVLSAPARGQMVLRMDRDFGE